MLQRSLLRAQRTVAQRAAFTMAQRNFSSGMKIYGASGEYAHTILDSCIVKPVPEEGEKPAPWKAADPKKVLAKLSSFAEYYDDNSDLREYLADNEISAEERHATLAGDVYKQIGMGSSDEDDTIADTVVMLMQDNTLELLPDIAADFEALVADMNSEVTCTVTSAVPLKEAQCSQIEAKIKSVLEKGKKPLVSFQVDVSLLGGLTIDVGGKFQDLSARSALVQGEEALRSL